MVGVEDEEDVEGALEDRVDLVLADLPHHVEEVGGVGELVVGEDRRHPDAEAVAVGGQRGHLGDEPQDLLVAVLDVEDVLGLGVVRRQRGDTRQEHAHGVGVVVEALHEALADVVVEEGVVDDVEGPLVELGLVRQLAVEQQVGHLEVGRVLGQLLDGVAAVAQDAGVAVEVGDGRRAGRGREEGGVVEPQVGIELAQRRGGERAVHDRDGHLLPGPIVDQRDGVGHHFPFRSSWPSPGLEVTDPRVGGRQPAGSGSRHGRRCPARPAGPAGAGRTRPSDLTAQRSDQTAPTVHPSRRPRCHVQGKQSARGGRIPCLIARGTVRAGCCRASWAPGARACRPGCRGPGRSRRGCRPDR